ncbi:outer membrane beta-barrel protein [Endozoicomonas numazuensis]|uniref:Outer membrane protein beta-barrel domain-containing protein n=1 Tax=Endozoicomonas numazuensis TaxID=1137799 RepID=A0A081NJ81_9GAMM|nr:outer membrane beta-barrel protein [Endozoicomonas numazuensis]KEQ18504.1 hypothetical protein GZ78_13555 [Endozoicomonas numazuensis]
MSSSGVKGSECINALSFDSLCLQSEITAEVKYDDNVFRSQRKRSSPVYILSPKFSTLFRKENNVYRLTFSAEKSDYSRFQSGSFFDYSLSGVIKHELNSRHRVNFKVSDELSHELSHDVGSENESDNTLFPEYRQQSISGIYGFGSKKAEARIDFVYQMNTRNYSDEGFNDRQVEDYGTTFYFQLMPDTDAVFEVSRRTLQYLDLDDTGYEITSYLAGINWDFSVKTSLSLKLGRRFRTTDASLAGKEGFTGWDTGFVYKPKTYSTFKLTAGQNYGLDADEPQSADFTRGRFIRFSWNHNWRARLATRVGWSYSDDWVLNGAGTKLKQRDVYQYSLGLFYELRRWLTLSLNWAYTVRREDSVTKGSEPEGYARNRYAVTGKISL